MTKLPRREFLHLAATAAALPALPRIASALDYPTRPVRIIVGFAPGGATSISARLIGQWLSERLGRQFIVENRSRAGRTTRIASVENRLPLLPRSLHRRQFARSSITKRGAFRGLPGG